MGSVYYAPGQTASVGENTEKRTPIIVEGTLDRLMAQAWAFGWLPKVISNGNLGNLYLHDVSVNERRGGVGLWDGEGIYKTTRMHDPGCGTWEFDTTAETTHITQALQTVGSWDVDSATPYDFKGVIGQTATDVQGTDILWPKFDFNENWRLPTTFCDFAYSTILATITAHTNLYTFRGFPPLSVLLVGATGRWSRRDPLWTDLSFKFRVGQSLILANVNDLEDSGDSTVITKGYWEYLWFYYRESASPAGNTPGILRYPLAARTERVYNSADFSLLGIPTGLPPLRDALPPPVFTGA